MIALAFVRRRRCILLMQHFSAGTPFIKRLQRADLKIKILGFTEFFQITPSTLRGHFYDEILQSLCTRVVRMSTPR